MTKSTKSKMDNQPMPLKAAEPEAGAAMTLTKHDTILTLLAKPHGASLDEDGGGNRLAPAHDPGHADRAEEEGPHPYQ